MLERIRNINKLLENNPKWFATQPLRDDATEWEVIQWEKALGTYNPPFVPQYRLAIGSDGQMSWPLPDSDYFATRETAQLMANRYGDGTVTEVDFGGTGGLFTCSEKELHITVNGELKNAGLIAAYYKRNPEDRFPGVADKLIRQVLGL